MRISDEEKEKMLIEIDEARELFDEGCLKLENILSTICSTYSLDKESMDRWDIIKMKHIIRHYDDIPAHDKDNMIVRLKNFFAHDDVLLEMIIHQYFFATIRNSDHLKISPISNTGAYVGILLDNIQSLLKRNTPINYYDREYRKLRLEILIEQGEVCAKCSAKPSPGVSMTIDHIKPVSKYPELFLDKSNMQVLCFDCNKEKSNYHETDYRKG